MAHYGNVPFHWMMPALYISAGIMLIIDFHDNKRASLLRFILRACLTALIVFGLFPGISIWAKLAAAAYMIVVLSIFSYIISDKFHNIGALCFVVLMFNLFTVLFFYISIIITEHGQLFDILIAISTFSILSYFMILNIDASRRFGVDVIKIPGTTKRVMLVILAIFCILVILLSIMPWIVEALETLLSIVRSLLSQLIGIFTFTPEPQPGNLQENPGLPPFIGAPDPIQEPGLFYHVLMWLSVAILIIVMLFAIIFALVKITLLIVRLFITDHQRKKTNNEVFTETIEKVAPKRKEQKLRSYFKRPRYSSLLTDRERILYIYNEYVRRAKRTGLTHNSLNDTPNEVLDEITKNISESSFPLPENLSAIFSIARYSDSNTDNLGADELKRRLL